MENKNCFVKKASVAPVQLVQGQADHVENSKNASGSISFKQLLELAGASDPKERNGVKTYRGFTFKYPEEILNLVPDHFQMVSEWCYDTFRVVWISERDLSLFTYVEGDLVLELCENMEVFNEKIEKTSEFYEEH